MGQRMYQGKLLDNQPPLGERVRLVRRAADGEPVDITDAFEAERVRIRAAERQRSRDKMGAIAGGLLIALMLVAFVVFVASVIHACPEVR